MTMVKIDRAGEVRVNGYPAGRVQRDPQRPSRWTAEVQIPADTAAGYVLERVPARVASRHAAVDGLIQARLG